MTRNQLKIVWCVLYGRKVAALKLLDLLEKIVLEAIETT